MNLSFDEETVLLKEGEPRSRSREQLSMEREKKKRLRYGGVTQRVTSTTAMADSLASAMTGSNPVTMRVS